MLNGRLWAIEIYNMINIICFTVLSVLFNKWWIILFSILFLGNYGKVADQEHLYYRICDRCGKHSEYAESFNGAINKAIAAGWYHRYEDGADFCNECRFHIDEENND